MDAAIARLGIALGRAGRYQEVLEYAQQSLELKTKLYGPDHLQVIRSIESVGYSLARLGRLGEAEEHYRRALAKRETALGPEHFTMGNVLANLDTLLEPIDRWLARHR